MKKVSVSAVVLVAVVAVLLVVVTPMGEAVLMNCIPEEMFSPCLVASMSPPSRTCCQKVKEQRRCLCGYLQSPSLRQYLIAPGAKWIMTSCGVPFPTC
ncbi:Bifunctional inhibitor/plant lipid transfer protein/seed storage helical domain [Sesbania bispinosa]|nr:Bifunctional inhibitor/plant lipid transfer protein/seed storage helical domain [Sesbania bispinosa]